MQDIKGIRTNYELLYVPIPIMSEQWAKFEAYFSCEMMFVKWNKKVRNYLSKQ